MAKSVATTAASLLELTLALYIRSVLLKRLEECEEHVNQELAKCL